MGVGRNFIRLRHLSAVDNAIHHYVTLLLEYVDEGVAAFPVVDVQNFDGREISGTESERGATAAHVVFRMPLVESELDVGRYRCVVESVAPLTRRSIEHFLCRQLRRVSDAEEWTFPVEEQKGRRGKRAMRAFRYTPRLELFGEVGRSLGIATAGGRELAYMVFTKRETRQSIGRGAEIDHTHVLANVNIRVSASQAPKDPVQRKTWVEQVRGWFTAEGYDSKLYFRHPDGSTMGGEVHHAIGIATDLLMCPKEVLKLEQPAKRWQPAPNDEVVSGMRALLDEDRLWERNRSG